MAQGIYPRRHRECAGGCGRSIADRVNINPVCRWCRQGTKTARGTKRVRAPYALLSLPGGRALKVSVEADTTLLVYGFRLKGRHEGLAPITPPIRLPTDRLPKLHHLIGRMISG